MSGIMISFSGLRSRKRRALTHLQGLRFNGAPSVLEQQLKVATPFGIFRKWILASEPKTTLRQVLCDLLHCRPALV